MPLASLFSNLSVAKPTAAPPTVDKEGAQSASKEATRPPPPPPPKPSHHEVLPRSIPLREYQRALISDADRLFEQGERAVLAYLPTGGGKTRVGAAAMLEWALLRAPTPSRCLFVVNRRSLLQQTRDALIDLGFAPGSVALIAGSDAGGGGDTKASSALPRFSEDEVLSPGPAAAHGAERPADEAAARAPSQPASLIDVAMVQSPRALPRGARSKRLLPRHHRRVPRCRAVLPRPPPRARGARPRADGDALPLGRGRGPLARLPAPSRPVRLPPHPHLRPRPPIVYGPKYSIRRRRSRHARQGRPEAAAAAAARRGGRQPRAVGAQGPVRKERGGHRAAAPRPRGGRGREGRRPDGGGGGAALGEFLDEAAAAGASMRPAGAPSLRHRSPRPAPSPRARQFRRRGGAGDGAAEAGARARLTWTAPAPTRRARAPLPRCATRPTR